MKQLIEHAKDINAEKVAEILRDRTGTNENDLGNGNPRAINQLIAHHSVIFQPGQLKMWVSTEPWQVGEYICYDLNKVFELSGVPDQDIDEMPLEIAADPFIETKEYQDFLKFRKLKFQLNEFIYDRSDFVLDEDSEKEFISSNPKYYEVYMILGMYFKKLKQYDKAKMYFKLALDKVVASKEEEEKIKALMKKCK
jgi:tetratricopeptide (TPR) repeat protein